MSETMRVVLNVNGTGRAVSVEPRKTLADAIREDLGLTGLTGLTWVTSTAYAAPARSCSTERWSGLACSSPSRRRVRRSPRSRG